MAASAAPTAAAPHVPAPPFLVDFLRSAKWRVGGASEGLLPFAKEFEFKNERLTGRFVNDLADALLRNKVAPGVVASARVSAVKVAVSIARPCADSVPYTQDEVDAAQVVDAVAAELQLGGGWN